MVDNDTQKLAVDGGQPVRNEPMPARGLIGQEDKAAAMQVFDESIESGNAFLYNGKFEQEYEQAFVDYMGGGFADGVNSGTNAVFCALGGLRLEPFSEVIVPPISDPGGVMPVVFTGCVPVPADSDPRSFNTNAEEIEKRITERTKAIVVAHIAGDPCDMDPIMELAEKHGLYVVEDCAQAHGATYKGKMVGKFGHIAAFSTMAGKHHCTGGQGGVVYSTNEELFWHARRFADRGKPFNIGNAAGNIYAGLNCNLNELSAAIGTAQLKKLPKILERRRFVGESLKKALEECRAVSLAWQTAETESAYWFLKFKLDTEKLSVDKETFCKALEAEIMGLLVIPAYNNIACEKPWFQQQKVFGESGFPWQCAEYQGEKKPVYEMPNAKAVIDSHFVIIIFESYGQQEISQMVTAIKKVEAQYLK